MTFRLKGPLSIAATLLLGLAVVAGASCASPADPPAALVPSQGGAATTVGPTAAPGRAATPASPEQTATGAGQAAPASNESRTAIARAPTPGGQPADASPTSTAAPADGARPTPGTYDSTDAMYRVLSEFGVTFPTTSDALKDILRERDTSQVAVLIESIRFIFDTDTAEQVASALRELTGQNFDRREWDKWMEWLGRNREDYQPPEGYAAWKVNLLSELDNRYTDLLADAGETTRIDLTEVVWGGVVIDGIPDLRDPNVIPADEADYLAPRERVFGVSINGQHRAYPLRITNPHEMVNDTLGGEPIALAW